MRFVTLAATIVAGGALASCSPQLPKAYGTYAQDGRSLVDLSAPSTTNRHTLSKSTRLIVFARELATPGLSPSRVIHLLRNPFFRSRHSFLLQLNPSAAQAILNAPQTPSDRNSLSRYPIERTQITPLGFTHESGADIGFRLEPLGSTAEMLAVVPVAPLDPGGYVLRVDLPNGTQSFPFLIDISPDQGVQEREDCRDDFVYAVLRPEGFRGWDQWFTDIQNMDRDRARRLLGGNPVIASFDLACSTTDTLPDLHVAGLQAATPTEEITRRELNVTWHGLDPSIRAFLGVFPGFLATDHPWSDIPMPPFPGQLTAGRSDAGYVGKHPIQGSTGTEKIDAIFGGPVDSPPTATTTMVEVYMADERGKHFFSQVVPQTLRWRVPQKP